MVTYEMADSGCKTIKQYLSNFPSLLSFIGSKIESTLFPTNSNFICNELHFEYSHTARIDSTCPLRFRTYSPNLYYCQQGVKEFFKRGVYFGEQASLGTNNQPNWRIWRGDRQSKTIMRIRRP